MHLEWLVTGVSVDTVLAACQQVGVPVSKDDNTLVLGNDVYRGRVQPTLLPSNGVVLDMEGRQVIDVSTDGVAMKAACANQSVEVYQATKKNGAVRTTSATSPTPSISPSISPSIPSTFHFITWNCLSAFPQHYAELQQQPPTVDLRPSLAHNTTRHHAIVRTLQPALERLVGKSPSPLNAIVLQEVDQDLKQLLENTLAADYPSLMVFAPPHPYIGKAAHKWLHVEPTGHAPQHDFSYWLVTIVRRSDVRPDQLRKMDSLTPGRFLVTPLRTCTIINLHLSWVPDTDPRFEMKSGMSRRMVDTLANQIHSSTHRRSPNTRSSTPKSTSTFTPPSTPTFVLGDMNASCPLNQMLYDTYFPATRFTRATFGESFKLDTEHIGQRKTFKGIDTMGQDDGWVGSSEWTVQKVTTDVLTNKRLPVEPSGWFQSFDGVKGRGRWASDHALVEVCVGRASS